MAAAHYASEHNLEFQLFEGNSQLGGLCRTLEAHGFRFDTGAHRIHDTDGRVLDILGKYAPLNRVNASSRIVDGNRFIEFPLSLGGIMRSLGWTWMARAGIDLISQRLRPQIAENFEAIARHRYGGFLADRFLLNYSRKLWGIPCNQLSHAVAGPRLRGLDAKSLIQSIVGRRTASAEGAFYYPENGIGSLWPSMACSLGAHQFNTNHRVTKLLVEDSQIHSVQINGTLEYPVDQVISSLPMTSLVHLLDPPPPEDIIHASRQLRFRDLVLVALFIEQPQVTPFATLYFPDPFIPFTRVFEPNNRCARMSPPGHTSLVIENPCMFGDPTWLCEDGTIVEQTVQHLNDLNMLNPRSVTGFHVVRLRKAYPVIDVYGTKHTARCLQYLKSLKNMHVVGRNANFNYTSIHHQFQGAQRAVLDLAHDRPKINRIA
ncbi:MAG: FAD-dependent oxidoreductase [Acidobacteria bacterium]|nr:FAD-dependent oxidoreductase [Acidobacteriota bacterium]